MTHDFADTLLAVALGRAISADLTHTAREPLPEEWQSLLDKLDQATMRVDDPSRDEGTSEGASAT